jgi:hypothetical protein
MDSLHLVIIVLLVVVVILQIVSVYKSRAPAETYQDYTSYCVNVDDIDFDTNTFTKPWDQVKYNTVTVDDMHLPPTICPANQQGLTYKPGQCINCTPQYDNSICVGSGDPYTQCIASGRQSTGQVTVW